MNQTPDADDLALLAGGFEAAMVGAAGPGEADQALYDLGWAELLAAAPARGAATAFKALGTTGAAAGLLDDVVAHALNVAVSIQTCAVFPAPLKSTAPAIHRGNRVAIDGLVSARARYASTATVAVDCGGKIQIAGLDTSLLPLSTAAGVDPGRAYHRVATRITADQLEWQAGGGTWDSAVVAARVALAHQLLGGARWMLDEACRHALNRVQFGRPVASFQAIRHKLAESLVEIEGASSVAESCIHNPHPLPAALAKSLAGRAARTTATHAQQVLAGIGFTAEHRFHRWLKRMLVLDTLFGSANSLPAEIGRHLLAQETVPRLIQL